ncbi:3-oxoacyl-[acyl-carrier-protein] synthase-3 [Microbacterium trichothecenolyticum]|uniref:3-oxoacyl-ACP synthase III family protein n=1 Tax=Microbacterium trichothecenolyticum TaxID=69370 RepID=UPI0028624CD7|nr:ketoacyl-ACP synthase III [Microbacterium trichothecenolyticum]MDR7185324.1 3-oxoacyl-[acyl-carrier-protein] synthase-3 [Microbacterium trichothecenolyticum]
MVKAFIQAVDYHLPAGSLSNEDLNAQFPEWSVDKIAAKTGIENRRIAAEDELSSDLAAAAIQNVLARTSTARDSIDFLIVCTQSPDRQAAGTAAAVQAKAGLPLGIGALEFNLGCSGYVYALGLAKAFIESGMASSIIVATVDTYSKYLNPSDKSVRTIFGDGAAATIVSSTSAESEERIYGLVYGTDGTGAPSLIVPNGGLGDGTLVSPQSAPEVRGLVSNGSDLYMDGPAIFNFTLDVVPTTVERVLHDSDLQMEEIDLFVFHQANRFMLEHLRKRLRIDPDRFWVSMSDTGNTVSSTIPIALREAEKAGVLRPGMKVMLVGFGVGLSWGGLVTQW